MKDEERYVYLVFVVTDGVCDNKLPTENTFQLLPHASTNPLLETTTQQK